MTSQNLLVYLYDETIKEQQESEENRLQPDKNIEEVHDKTKNIALPTTSSDQGSVDTKSLQDVNFTSLKLEPDGEYLPLLDRHDTHFNQFPGKSNTSNSFIQHLNKTKIIYMNGLIIEYTYDDVNFCRM